MGIYDRDYYREEGGGFGLRGPRSVVGWLLVVNIVVYLASQLLFSNPNWLSDQMGARVDTLANPLQWWRFLTYGFAHAAQPMHIILNMLTLWIFGRDIESRYGPKEFLRLYVVILVAGSVLWAAVNRLQGVVDSGPLVGASGAITAVVMLYALNFPHRTLLLFFILPVPAWVVGVLLVLSNLFGALGSTGAAGQGGPNIAYSVHLTGAALAFLYYRFGWNFGRLIPSGLSLEWLRPKAPLRVHEPQSDDEDTVETDLNAEVDRILEKIHREGESSLSRKERRILENASRQYQRKRQPGSGRT